MRVLRAYVEGAAFRDGAEFDLPEEESRHLSQVLRAREGMMVELLDGRGGLATAEVTHAGKSRVSVRIESLAPVEPPPARRIELAPSLTRTDAFDDMLHRAVELGMTAFRPIAADHSVVELDARKAQARLERWGRIAREALKQSERRWMPVLEAPAGLSERLAWGQGEGILVLGLLERGEGIAALSGVLPDIGRRGVLIVAGPEGGWSAGERKLLGEMACPVSLGSAILRAETASLAALALVSL